MVKIVKDQKTLKDEVKSLKAQNVILTKNIGILSGELNKQSRLIAEAEMFKKQKKNLMKRLKENGQELQGSKNDVSRLRDEVHRGICERKEIQKNYQESKQKLEQELADVREKLSKVSEERNTLKGQKRKLEQDAEKSKKKIQRLEGITNFKALADGIELLRQAQERLSTTGLLDEIKQKTQEALLSEATELGYISSITQDMFVDPVLCSDGQVYERKMIERWFNKGNKTSPNTNAVLITQDLVPDIRLKSQIEAWKKINNYDEIVAKENTVDLTKK